jgi:hypothetical protein
MRCSETSQPRDEAAQSNSDGIRRTTAMRQPGSTIKLLAHPTMFAAVTGVGTARQAHPGTKATPRFRRHPDNSDSSANRSLSTS